MRCWIGEEFAWHEMSTSWCCSSRPGPNDSRWKPFAVVSPLNTYSVPLEHFKGGKTRELFV